jgi:hypothetical protein
MNAKMEKQKKRESKGMQKIHRASRIELDVREMQMA